MPTNPNNDLRDRIAEALYAHDHPGWYVPLRESDVEPAYRERAAAVLAVLPEPTSRAAVLREAIDVAREEGHRLEAVAGIEAARGARCVAYLLRKLLAKEGPRRRDVEARQQPETEAPEDDCDDCGRALCHDCTTHYCIGPCRCGTGAHTCDCACTEYQDGLAADEEPPCWCGHAKDRHWSGATDMTFPDGCHDCRGWNGAHAYGQELPWLPEGDDVPAPVAQQPETEAPFVPPVHYRGRDGTAYCVHATPIGPDSCRECRELADAEASPAAPPA